MRKSFLCLNHLVRCLNKFFWPNHLCVCACVCVRVCACVCVCARRGARLVAQLCQTVCNPMDCRPPGSSVHGILQARILEWVAMPSSRGSSQPRNRRCLVWMWELDCEESWAWKNLMLSCGSGCVSTFFTMVKLGFREVVPLAQGYTTKR